MGGETYVTPGQLLADLVEAAFDPAPFDPDPEVAKRRLQKLGLAEIFPVEVLKAAGPGRFHRMSKCIVS